MNIRYTKEWAEPNTKHYESLFRKIKDSVDELEGIFVQRNEMIKYIEELHNLLQPPYTTINHRDTKEPSPNEGFGKYNSPKEENTERCDRWCSVQCLMSDCKKYHLSEQDKRPKKGYISCIKRNCALGPNLTIHHFSAFDFKEALEYILKSNPTGEILSLELENIED